MSLTPYCLEPTRQLLKFVGPFATILLSSSSCYGFSCDRHYHCRVVRRPAMVFWVIFAC